MDAFDDNVGFLISDTIIRHSNLVSSSSLFWCFTSFGSEFRLVILYDVSTNFDVRLSASGTIWTTYGGYRYSTQLRIGSTSMNLRRGQPANLFGTAISINLTQLSANAILVAFRLQNSNASDQTVDVGVFSDVSFDRNDAAPIDPLSNNRGFVMHSTTNVFILIGRDDSLVRSLTMYWRGYLGSRSANLWTHTSATTFSGDDSGMAFS
jgi:hypothetical protein